MGNLHAGHLQLVQEARKSCDRAVVSLFVNPLQFGPGEDFARYPRTLDEDMAQLEHGGTDAIFVPDVETLYPKGFKTQVLVREISDILCGEFRPGHFTGVATVVLKLLNIVQPDLAIFGRKDFQQLVIIQRMVQDLALPVTVIGVDTVREHDGLAMSSRNQYLSPEQRRIAPVLYRTLLQIRDRIISGERNWRELEDWAMRSLENADFMPQYISIRRVSDFSVQNEGEITGDLVILTAAHLGSTRLIDNIICPVPG